MRAVGAVQQRVAVRRRPGHVLGADVAAAPGLFSTTIGLRAPAPAAARPCAPGCRRRLPAEGHDQVHRLVRVTPARRRGRAAGSARSGCAERRRGGSEEVAAVHVLSDRRSAPLRPLAGPSAGSAGPRIGSWRGSLQAHHGRVRSARQHRGAATNEVDRLHAHHPLAALVEHLDQRLHQAAIRLRLGAARREDRQPARKACRRAARRQPAQFVEPRRAEAGDGRQVVAPPAAA